MRQIIAAVAATALLAGCANLAARTATDEAAVQKVLGQSVAYIGIVDGLAQVAGPVAEIVSPATAPLIVQGVKALDALDSAAKLAEASVATDLATADQLAAQIQAQGAALATLAAPFVAAKPAAAPNLAALPAAG